MDTPRFNNFLHSIADAGKDLLRAHIRSARGKRKSLPNLCDELLSTKGEASGIAFARDVVDQYHRLNDRERIEFFEQLNDALGVNHDAVLQAASAYCESQDPLTLRQLTMQIEPRRQELFRRINTAPGGTETIIQMRHDLLQLLKSHPHLEAIDFDLQHLLASWFNRGFLELRQIDWESPAVVLEKLIQYESVHEIKGWGDLRGRLAVDRRCFAFFHPTLPNEPLIFVEVALVKGLADSINPIIDANRTIRNPQKADTAVFYSINNCLPGLMGVSFGNLLIKQVVQHLFQEFPGLKYFSTLSPIPRFQRWLQSSIDDLSQFGISPKDHELLLKTQTEGWFEDETILQSLEPVLLKLCAYYLAYARKGDEPLDPVARFHLRNGAKLERINWLGDRSANGIGQSAGMLANYVYDPDTIVQNHERYVIDHEFAIAKSIIDLVPKPLRTDQPEKKAKRSKR